MTMSVRNKTLLIKLVEENHCKEMLIIVCWFLFEVLVKYTSYFCGKNMGTNYYVFLLYCSPCDRNHFTKLPDLFVFMVTEAAWSDSGLSWPRDGLCQTGLTGMYVLGLSGCSAKRKYLCPAVCLSGRSAIRLSTIAHLSVDLPVCHYYKGWPYLTQCFLPDTINQSCSSEL